MKRGGNMKKDMVSSITVRVSAVVISALLLFSVPSVFAVWIYTYETVTPQEEKLNVNISEFKWDSEEVLPSDKPGENHYSLVNEILNNVKVGLNASKDTLENAVKTYKILYSSQNIQGGNLKHLFTTQESYKLDFVIQYIDDSLYYLYTFENDDLAAAALNMSSIIVYRTELKCVSGIWDTEGTTIGHSIVRPNPSGNIRTINPEEWIAGQIPKN